MRNVANNSRDIFPTVLDEEACHELNFPSTTSSDWLSQTIFAYTSWLSVALVNELAQLWPLVARLWGPKGCVVENPDSMQRRIDRLHFGPREYQREAIE